MDVLSCVEIKTKTTIVMYHLLSLKCISASYEVVHVSLDGSTNLLIESRQLNLFAVLKYKLLKYKPWKDNANMACNNLDQRDQT